MARLRHLYGVHGRSIRSDADRNARDVIHHEPDGHAGQVIAEHKAVKVQSSSPKNRSCANAQTGPAWLLSVAFVLVA